MAVLTRSLEGAWQITYDVEARQLFVNEGTAAETKLEGLIIDMFPNTPEDDDRAEGPN